MTDTIKISDIEACAFDWLQRVANSKDDQARRLRLEWAFGLSLMLRGCDASDAADRIADRCRELDIDPD